MSLPFRRDSRIYIAGHRGLVGSAIRRTLERHGFHHLILRAHEELDLIDQAAVTQFFRDERPQFVFHVAGKVGGIIANSTQQPEFLYENLMVAANVVYAAAQTEVEKLLFVGSSCMYPRLAPQPIPESALLAGPLEPTNEGYAIAKIAGVKLCEALHRQRGKRFISAIPTNLYGPWDNFDPLNSHVIPGMMRRFHEARVQGDREVMVWGSGAPRREFLFVDDLAEALFLLMGRYEEPDTINVGTGEDITIRQLAETMKEVTGFDGQIVFDPSKPDGMPRKLLEISRIRALGWRPTVALKDGLQRTYRWAVENDAFHSVVQPSTEGDKNTKLKIEN